MTKRSLPFFFLAEVVRKRVAFGGYRPAALLNKIW